MIESIHNDKGLPLWLVRSFHNKPVAFSFDMLKIYLSFFDLKFLLLLILPLGLVGLSLGIYYFIKEKKKNLYLWTLLLFLIISPIPEMFFYNKLPFSSGVILISAPFILWATFGYYMLLLHMRKKAVIITSFLLGISIWFLLVSSSLPRPCL